MSLLRPQVYEDLDLQKYGMKVYLRDPNAYTPLIEPLTIKGQKVTSLLLGRDSDKNRQQIAQFSEKDAEVMHIAVHFTTNLGLNIGKKILCIFLYYQ